MQCLRNDIERRRDVGVGQSDRRRRDTEPEIKFGVARFCIIAHVHACDGCTVIIGCGFAEPLRKRIAH